MKKRNLTTLPAALALTAMALTGCGNSEGGSATGSDTSSSSSAGSSAALTASDFGSRIQAAQQEAGSFRFTMETVAAALSQEGTGEARLDGDTPAVHVTIGSGAQAIETITVDGAYYMKAAFLQTEKPWLKIDPDAKTGLGALIGQLGGNQDPTSLTKAFGKVSDVEKGAEEDVDGVTATKYTVTVSGADLAKTLGMPAETAQLLPKEINYDIWVDENDLPVQMKSVTQVQGQESTMTMKFSDYGSDVTVEAPPADQVTTKQPALPGNAS